MMDVFPMLERSPWLSALAGGVALGLASVGLWWTHGRIAGISGIFGRVGLVTGEDRAWRVAFLAGLIAGGVVLRVALPQAFTREASTSLPVLLLAGALVGVGTQQANGCTSGHGVCGLSRRSPRSLASVVTFMGVAMATVFFVRHALGLLAGARA